LSTEHTPQPAVTMAAVTDRRVDPAEINLALLRRTEAKYDEHFRDVFIGVLCAKLTPKVWAEAIATAERAVSR
jgi:hypothetical protein